MHGRTNNVVNYVKFIAHNLTELKCKSTNNDGTLFTKPIKSPDRSTNTITT